MAASAGDLPRLAPHGRPRLAIPLWRSGAVVLLELDQRSRAPQLLELAAEPLQVADQRLRSALEIVELHGTMARLEHSELLQRSLFAISDLAGSDCDMPELLKGIHAIVDRLMYARELLHRPRSTPSTTLLRFLYFVDVEDPPPQGDVSLREREGTLTWYVLHDGKPLRGDNDAAARAGVRPAAASSAATATTGWACRCCATAWSRARSWCRATSPASSTRPKTRPLLEFVGSHILTALERKQHQDDLERSVQQRTLELAEANLGLQLEIVERERAERLQAALFQIAQLATAESARTSSTARVQAVVGELINAENFFIALLSDDRTTLEFPYAVDDQRRASPSRARSAAA